MNTISNSEAKQTIELTPSYKIPLVLIVAALPFVVVQKWVSLAIALLGIFLLIQTLTIRLKFTERALEVYRLEKLLRNFPYHDMIHWKSNSFSIAKVSCRCDGYRIFVMPTARRFYPPSRTVNATSDSHNPNTKKSFKSDHTKNHGQFGDNF